MQAVKGQAIMKKALALSLALILLAALCCCKSREESDESSGYDVTKTQAVKSLPIDATLPPAKVNYTEKNSGRVFIKIPQVTGTSYDANINSAIMAAADRLSQENESSGISLDYFVGYNANGIFSVYLSVSSNTIVVDHTALTFNVASGERISLGDLFNENWQERLLAIVNAAAFSAGVNLISEITEIDDKDFYLSGQSLFVLYDLYEVSDYDAGAPIFEVEYSNIADITSSKSAIAAILAASSQNEM